MNRVQPSSGLPPKYRWNSPTLSGRSIDRRPDGGVATAVKGNPNSWASACTDAAVVEADAGIQNVPGAQSPGGFGSRYTEPPALSTRLTARKLSFQSGVRSQPADPDPVILPVSFGGDVSFSSFAVSFSSIGNDSTPM